MSVLLKNSQQQAMSLRDTLDKIKLSRTDVKLGGVCGGLARATETPSWIWRAAFLLTLPLGGFGVIAYLVFWAVMPKATG